MAQVVVVMVMMMAYGGGALHLTNVQYSLSIVSFSFIREHEEV
jgi:hypothetical protein